MSDLRVPSDSNAEPDRTTEGDGPLQHDPTVELVGAEAAAEQEVRMLLDRINAGLDEAHARADRLLARLG
jgi:hypothetical protein